MMRWIAMVGALAFLGGCSFGRDLSATDAAVVTFHHQLDAGSYDAILRDADPEVTASRAELTQLLTAVHDRLGPVTSFRRVGFNESLNGNGHLVTVDYQSTYRNGPAQESFTYRISDGRPALAGYHIQSNALIIGAPSPGVGARLAVPAK